MKISVIITIYNEEKYLKQCLQSLAEQKIKDFEIVAVDDGSTDSTKKVLLAIKPEIKNLRIYEQSHQGLAAARNLGARKAKAKILVFVDGDMFFEKTFLKDLVKPILDAKAKGTYSTQEYVANWDNVWAKCWNYNWHLPKKRRVDPQRKDQALEFRAILKSEFDKVGGLDSLGYTDAWSLSQKLGYKPRATLAKYYHYNPSSLKDVFFQAKWVAKRRYKLGMIGKVIALLRANPIFSFINGIKTAMIKREAFFVIFKFVYDAGVTFGLLERKKYA